MAPLFDRYIAVDWSAANAPVRGRNAIWIATATAAGSTEPFNPPTRAEAMAELRAHLLAALSAGERVLVGFDFAFGFPRGVAATLTGIPSWQALWHHLADAVDDAPDNRSNRYAVAEAFNRRLVHQPARFWGHPHGQTYAHLSPTRPPFDAAGLPERRLVEARHRGTKPIWQLAYAGSVGSQSLLGIARLAHLRRDPDLGAHLAIWPFETGFADDLGKPLLIAEIYPSLYDIAADPDPIRDRAQVRAVVAAMARADRDGTLRDSLAAPSDLSPADRAVVLAEEGWILAA